MDNHATSACCHPDTKRGILHMISWCLDWKETLAEGERFLLTLPAPSTRVPTDTEKVTECLSMLHFPRSSFRLYRAPLPFKIYLFVVDKRALPYL